MFNRAQYNNCSFAVLDSIRDIIKCIKKIKSTSPVTVASSAPPSCDGCHSPRPLAGVGRSSLPSSLRFHAVEPGDIYLLCSDGLSDMVTDEDMQLTLSSLKANLSLAAEQLVQQANDNGGRDNISVILVRIRKDFPARAGWLAKLKSWFK